MNPSHQPDSSRRIYAVACLLVAIAMMVGSWAPFSLADRTIGDSWRAFLSSWPPKTISRSDVVANVILGSPFAFCLLGYFSGLGRKPLVGWVMRVLAVWLLSVSLSLVCELGQGWFDRRVPSLLDVFAQAGGALIGVAVWCVCGRPLTRLLGELFAAPRLQTRVERLVTLVAIGILIWSLMPFDIITSPVDLARKWTHGRIELVPFTYRNPSKWEAIYQWTMGTLLGIPFGLWALQWSLRRGGRFLSVINQAWLAVGLGMFPELIQIPVRSRMAHATDALFGVLGALIGLGLGHWLGPRHDKPKQSAKAISQPGFWYLLALGYLIFLGALSWYPFQFVTDPEKLRELLVSVAESPFSDYRGSNMNVIFVLFRQGILSMIFGTLLGIAVGLIQRPSPRRVATIITVIALTLASILLELGQLVESTRSGAGIGLSTRIIGGLTGFSLGFGMIRGRRSTRLVPQFPIGID